MSDLINNFLWPTLANIVGLGVVAALGWYQFRKQHLHTLRMALFAELMGNRHDILGEHFTTAMNRILVLFHDDKAVARTARDFAQLAKGRKGENHHLVAVFRAICKNLGISEETFTDDDFTTAFNLRGDGPILVSTSVAHVVDAPHPQVVIMGNRSPNTAPATLSILDVASAKQLMADLQKSIELALARKPGP